VLTINKEKETEQNVNTMYIVPARHLCSPLLQIVQSVMTSSERN
jgi:hypothetical protein